MNADVAEKPDGKREPERTAGRDPDRAGQRAGASHRIRYLLRYADKRQRMGQVGHDFEREHFLLTRQLRDYLTTVLLLDKPEIDTLVA